MFTVLCSALEKVDGSVMRGLVAENLVGAWKM